MCGSPYFEWPDIEHDALRKLLLIKQDTEWIEWACSFFLFPSILEQFSFTNFLFTCLVQNVVEKTGLNL